MKTNVLVYIFKVLLYAYFYDSCNACDQSVYCTVEQWAPWGSCNATCGVGVQERTKMICCNPYFYNTLKGCLNGCNISFSWWEANATEHKTCGKCQRGGTFDFIQNSCICPSGYGGSCFDMQTTLPTTMKTTQTTTTTKPTTTKPTTIPTTTKTTTIQTTTKATKIQTITKTTTKPMTTRTTTKPTITKTTTIPTTIQTTTKPTTTKTTTIPTTTKTTTIPTTTKTTTIPTTTKTTTKPTTTYMRKTITIPTTTKTTTIPLTTKTSKTYKLLVTTKNSMFFRYVTKSLYNSITCTL
ncbi:Hypothetical predicted protein [Mytilus galloprovincialis]|uniref:Uncharacterized protein n=1 Tax=Mytilus galloprovincialis TaxID=29158 RepID=A0A8B6CLQ0_MYTGA|nr:Hypothetical predicted protein [Mytilus galloprovincialis]